jgi:hypothetical protein
MAQQAHAALFMGPDATKGIEYLDAEGNETLTDDDPYVFLRYEAAGILPHRKRPRAEALPSKSVPCMHLSQLN